MNRGYRKAAFLLILVLSACHFSGCGCGKKKEPDPESQQVLKLTIAPEATPTPDPVELNPDAVVTNGNVTMVNEYLAGGQ